jgi:hypothetical protein
MNANLTEKENTTEEDELDSEEEAIDTLVVETDEEDDELAYMEEMNED